MKQHKVYDEEKVIYLLKNKDKLRKSYNERELRLLKELETHSETIEGIALRCRELKEFIVSNTNVPSDPVFNVLESVEYDRKNMMYEQIRGLKEVAEKRMELDVLLNELDTMDEPYKSILEMLYVEGQSWKDIVAYAGKSKATCGRYRKEALYLLVEKSEMKIRA